MKNFKRYIAMLLIVVLTMQSGYISVSATTETETPEVLVNYLMVEEPVISVPGTQRIMLGIGDGTCALEQVNLQYRNTDSGELYEVTSNAMTEDFAVFEMEYADETFVGAYHLEGITFFVEGQSTSVSFSEMGIDAGFGVNQIVESTPDDVFYSDEDIEAIESQTEAVVVSLDEAGNTDAAEVIEDALRDADLEGNAKASQMTLVNAMKGAANDPDGLIIVLDPGHGGIDGGAQGYGVSEKAANLKIAKYCKEALEEYSGVTVYMTRSNNDTYLTLEQRANFAEEKKADIFVSLHINSNTSSAPNGANVYYPNANYNKKCNKVGKTVAAMIESNLTDLGLASGGIHIRNSGDGTTYGDGSLADYYGVIKRCKEYGIPAVLVEHAFVSNENDVKNFLSSNEQLKKLGEADAKAIVEYYGLNKEITVSIPQPEMAMIKSNNSTTLVVGWDAMDGVSGYEIYRAGKELGAYKKVGTVSEATTWKFTDTTVKEGKQYFYRVRAYVQNNGAVAYSEYSLPIHGRTAKQASDIKVLSEGSSTLKLTWTGDANASSYVIQRSTSATGGFKKIATIENAAITEYTDTTITSGTVYYYRIQTFNHNYGKKGKSGVSAPVGGKTLGGTKIIQIAGIAPKKMMVAWKTKTNVTGYEIYRSTVKNGSYIKVATISSAATGVYTDKKLVPGTKYFYKIRTLCNIDGNISYGSESKAKGAKLGTKPVFNSVQGTTGTKIKLSWNPVLGAKEYKLYKSTEKKGVYTQIATLSPDKLSYTDKKLKMTQNYYYRIEAVIKGYKTNGTTGYSKIVSSSPKKTGEITRVWTNESGQMQISWDRVKNITGYNVYRSTSANGNYTLVNTVSGAKNTTCIDTTAAVGTTYYYKLELIGKYNGEKLYGARSAAISGVRLGVPADVSVTSVSPSQLNITWSNVKGATGYYIFRSTEYKSGYTYMGAQSSKSGISYVDTTVTKGVTYYYKIRAYASGDNTGPYSTAASGCPVDKPAITTAKKDNKTKKVQLTWSASTASIKGYEIFRSTYSKPSVQTKIATLTGTSYTDTDIKAEGTYYYRIRTYTTVTVNGTARTVYGAFSDTVSTNTSDYRIMGSAGVTIGQMVAMYQASGKTYPANVYKHKGAADIKTFCQIVYEESCIEGVKPEVMFAQMCHETGYLQFGGQVKAEQCNFGGLGATDDGASGGTFADVRTGVRAQVQHMKAYASTDPLKQTCVDNRFGYVTRGKAEYIQQLGKGNWATDTAYDTKLLSYINKIKAQ